MIIKHSTCFILLLLLIMGTPNLAIAEDIAIIVHASNKQSIQLDDIVRIFLGKQPRSTDGSGEIVPIQLPDDDPLYRAFAERILKKSTSQLNAYWAKRIFTGKGKPPENAESRKDAKSKISQNPNFLGYIDAESVDSSVHTIITFRID